MIQLMKVYRLRAEGYARGSDRRRPKKLPKFLVRYERTLVAGGLIDDQATIDKPARARFYDGKAFRAQIPPGAS